MPHELQVLAQLQEAAMTDYQWELQVTTKGGPGSGNWRHTGLAGVHGGADPGGGLGTIHAWPDSELDAAGLQADEWYKDWAANLTWRERAGIAYYVSSGYSPINGMLRGEEKYTRTPGPKDTPEYRQTLRIAYAPFR